MSPAPRRWFRFSLRTLFVVVSVFALWIGWNANTVHKRRAAWTEIESRGGRINSSDDVYDLFVQAPEPPQLPLVRRWLGDRVVRDIILSHAAPQSEVDRLNRIFPEAVSILPQERYKSAD